MKVVSALITMSLASAALVTASATDLPVNSAASYLSASELVSKVAKKPSGDAYQLASSAGYTVLMIKRDKSGEVEVHTELNDTIIIERGTAKFRVGGTITGNHEVKPNEWRGGEMTGAKEYSLSPGDLLLIPAGVPHQAVVTSGPLFYLTIKTTKQHTSSP